MSEEARLQVLAIAATILLLIMTMIANAVVLLALSAALLIGGMVFIPRYRRRGFISAMIAAAVASAILAGVRLVRI